MIYDEEEETGAYEPTEGNSFIVYGTSASGKSN